MVKTKNDQLFIGIKNMYIKLAISKTVGTRDRPFKRVGRYHGGLGGICSCILCYVFL